MVALTPETISYGNSRKITKSFEKLCKHRHNFSLILKILSSVSNELHNLLSTLALLEITVFFFNPKSPRSLRNDISRLCTEFWSSRYSIFWWFFSYIAFCDCLNNGKTHQSSHEAVSTKVVSSAVRMWLFCPRPTTIKEHLKVRFWAKSVGVLKTFQSCAKLRE